jgi:hypothetical protein
MNQPQDVSYAYEFNGGKYKKTRFEILSLKNDKRN